LTDADRAPWLAAMHARLLEAFRSGRSLVVGCSALRQSYRAALAEGIAITWVYLKGSEALIRSRLRHRDGHYMKADMLASQFEALQEPSGAIIVSTSHSHPKSSWNSSWPNCARELTPMAGHSDRQKVTDEGRCHDHTPSRRHDLDGITVVIEDSR
jgi:gluconate kinase